MTEATSERAWPPAWSSTDESKQQEELFALHALGPPRPRDYPSRRDTRRPPRPPLPLDGEQLDAFAAIRAFTTHKSQGSEWPRVTVLDEFTGEDRKRWLYTAITRASSEVRFLAPGTEGMPRPRSAADRRGAGRAMRPSPVRHMAASAPLPTRCGADRARLSRTLEKATAATVCDAFDIERPACSLLPLSSYPSNSSAPAQLGRLPGEPSALIGWTACHTRLRRAGTNPSSASRRVI